MIALLNSSSIWWIQSRQKHLTSPGADFTAGYLFVLAAFTPQQAKLATSFLRSPKNRWVVGVRSTQTEKIITTAFPWLEIGIATDDFKCYTPIGSTVGIKLGPTRAIETIEGDIVIAQSLERNPVDGNFGV